MEVFMTDFVWINDMIHLELENALRHITTPQAPSAKMNLKIRCDTAVRAPSEQKWIGPLGSLHSSNRCINMHRMGGRL